MALKPVPNRHTKLMVFRNPNNYKEKSVDDRHENAVQLTSVTLNYNRLWHHRLWQGVNGATLLSTRIWNNPQTQSDVE